MVLYGVDNHKVLWASHTRAKTSDKLLLIVQNDTNVVLYSYNSPGFITREVLWATNTAGAVCRDPYG